MLQGTVMVEKEEEPRENPKMITLMHGEAVVFPHLCILKRTEKGGSEDY